MILPLPNGELKFSGEQFLFAFALPNFFFHVTTAHAILRHNGVPIGKMTSAVIPTVPTSRNSPKRVSGCLVSSVARSRMSPLARLSGMRPLPSRPAR